MRSLIRKTYFCIGLVACLPAAASPTSNEFQECHRVASQLLANCLDEHTNQGPGQEPCWTEARQANAACYASVQKKYDSGEMARRRAAIEREEARHRAEQEKK